MTRKVVLFIMLAVLLFTPSALAITATRNGNVVELTTIDADWNWFDTFPDNRNGIEVQTILFRPSGTNDVLVIEEATPDGPTIMYVRCNDTYDQRVLYLNGSKVRPLLDYSDCTISTPADASLHIILK